MSFRCLFHVHTRNSYDSLLSPERILATARQLDVDVLVVTDHNTIQGSLDVRKLAGSKPRFVLIAAEYATEKGDVIGVFLKDEIRTSQSNIVLQEIRRQGGMAVLPHPYKAHKLDDELFDQVDLIETLNSRCSPSENGQAESLALRRNLPLFGGADAHCVGELGAVLNHFSVDLPSDESALRDALLHSSRRIEHRAVSGVYRPYSQIIKAIKTRNPLLLLSQSKRLAQTWVRESWRHQT